MRAFTLPGHSPVVAAGAVWFQSPAHHIAFSYPATWRPAKDDTVLTLVPAGEASLGLHTLTVDTPDLPLHFPGFIPLGLVVQGFVKDLKTRYKDVTVAEQSDRVVAGVSGRQIRASGARAQGQVIVTALLCVRGDAVYIVDAETDRAGAAAAESAYETVVDSIQWMD